jgi:hypothetical protein
MGWDKCVMNDTSITETIYNEYKDRVRVIDDRWEYKNGDEWIEDEKYILDMIKTESCNEIIRLMERCQIDNELDLFSKNHRVNVYNNIYKYILNEKKFKILKKEMKIYFTH